MGACYGNVMSNYAFIDRSSLPTKNLATLGGSKGYVVRFFLAVAHNQPYVGLDSPDCIFENSYPLSAKALLFVGQ